MITRYFDELIAHINDTDSEYKRLYKKGLTVHPIPFFGNIQTAKILTVGINPSNGEFAKNRNWPNNIARDKLIERLLNYFSLPECPPHPWFKKWEEALNLLGISYNNGTAAHLDLSPRATNVMSSHKTSQDEKTFLKMAETDIEWFFKMLPLCPNAQLLLIAGTIFSHEKKFDYLDEFIQRMAKNHSHELREMDSGVRFHKITGAKSTLPVFFSSVSPSARDNPHLLVDRVNKYKVCLMSYLDKSLPQETDEVAELRKENERLRGEIARLKKIITNILEPS